MFNSKSGKCINIALDLGIFGDRSFSKGIEDLSKALPEIVKGKPSEFAVISGEDVLNFPIIACGGIGVISVLANTLPKLTADVVNLSLNSDNKKARDLHYSSINFTNLLFAEGNPAGVKAALKIQGICDDEVRMPLMKASEKLFNELQQELKTLG